MKRVALSMMCALMSILAAGPLVSGAGAATCTVANGDDGYDIFGIIPKSGTLRHCLSSFSISDVIEFDGDFTITIEQSLSINKSVTIDATGRDITIDGGNAHRVFSVSAEATLRNLKIVNGDAGGKSEGGGIYNNANLTLEGCELSSNSAEFGGAIFNEVGAALTMIDCRITNNQATVTGGGIYSKDADTDERTVSNLTKCEISGNQAEGAAGVYNLGILTMEQCEVFENVSSRSGGGIANDKYGVTGNATLTDCVVRDNEATKYGGGCVNLGVLNLKGGAWSGNSADYGGAISNEHGAHLYVSGAAFSGNHASSQGGGIYNDYASDTESRGYCTITNSSFSGNVCSQGGGLGNRGVLLMDGCEFSNNRAEAGEGFKTGAALLNVGHDGDPADADLNNCVFSGNQSEENGGAITNRSQLTLNFCDISNNSAGPDAGGQGGGMYNQRGQVTMTGCVLSGNAAAYGGALANFGNDAAATLVNCTLSGNNATSEKSGAIDLSLESPAMTLTNCTVASNTEVIAGILVDNGEITLKNTIVSGNGPLGKSNFRTTDGVITSAGYNMANDWNALTPGPTDMTADPLLEPLSACAGGPMVHALGENSPAIDAGTYEDAPARDQCGKLRFGIWDIGAWESPKMRMGLREALMALQISVGLTPAHQIKAFPIAGWLDVSGDKKVGPADAVYALRRASQSNPLTDPPCQSFEFSNDRVTFHGAICRGGVVDYEGKAKFNLASDRDIGGSRDISESEFCDSAEAPYQTVENCLYIQDNCLKTKGSYDASGLIGDAWDEQVICLGR